MVSQVDIDKKVQKVLENIRKIRTKKKISIINFANKAEVSHSYIYYLESNKKIPTLTVLFKIAEALEVDIKELFD